MAAQWPDRGRAMNAPPDDETIARRMTFLRRVSLFADLREQDTRVLIDDFRPRKYDNETRTYRFLKRNPDWEQLDPNENDRHKRHIDGYTRIFKDGRRKTFRYRPRR